MIFPSNRILPEGCSIIYKTYTSESDFYEIPKFTINFNDNIENFTDYEFEEINRANVSFILNTLKILLKKKIS